MAITSGVIWEVRTTGAMHNGGGFNRQRGGTDFSQQDSAQVVYSDIAIHGVNTRLISSAGNPFDSTHAGNIIRIDPVAGFLAGWFEIIQISGGVFAFLDRSAGTAGSTGGSGRLGGAIGGSTLGTPTFVIMGQSNRAWVQGGTYSATGTIVPTGTTFETFHERSIVGYGSVRGDSGKPIITVSASGTFPLWNLARNHIGLRNFTIEGSGLLRFGIAASGIHTIVDNVEVRHTRSSAFLLNNTVAGNSQGNIVLRRCAAVECSGQFGFGAFRITMNDNPAILFQCVAKRNEANGFQIDNCSPTLLYCLSIRNTDNSGFNNSNGFSHTVQSGFFTVKGFKMIYCVADTNQGAGLSLGSNEAMLRHGLVQNCIFSNNNRFGITNFGTLGHVDAASGARFRTNAFYANASGSYSRVVAGEGDVELSVSPFIDPNTENFALNNTVGGGAELQSVGLPGPFPYPLPNTFGDADIGAVQKSGG